MLANMVAEVGRNLGLGDSIQIIARELLIKIFDPAQGGLTHFAERIKNISGSDFATYLRNNHDEQSRLPESDVTQLLGRDTIASIASSASINNSSVITAASALLPKILNTICPDGRIPSAIPLMLKDYNPILANFDRLKPELVTSDEAALKAAQALSANAAMDSASEVRASRVQHVSWIVPALVLALLAWSGWRWISQRQTQVARTEQTQQSAAPQTANGTESVSQAVQESQQGKASLTEDEIHKNLVDAPVPQRQQPESARAALAPKLLEQESAVQIAKMDPQIPQRIVSGTVKTPSTLSLRNANSRILISGIVPDESLKQSMLGSMSAIFGSNAVDGEILVDPNASIPNWMGKLSAIAPELKVKGLRIEMKGDTIKIGGDLPRQSLNSLLTKLQNILGPGFLVATELGAEAPTPTPDALKLLKNRESGGTSAGRLK